MSQGFIEDFFSEEEDNNLSFNLDDKAQRKSKGQKWKENQLNKQIASDIQVSTVDAFQGSEKGFFSFLFINITAQIKKNQPEIIVISCVRSSRLGFIDSPHRLNVALTRGRRYGL